MKLRLLTIVAVGFTLCGGTAFAQNAFRCDQDGKTVYSDKPCPAAKVVAPTQDTPEQRAAARQANDQMRKDANDLNKRLSDREKLEAQERAAVRKANAAAKAKDAKAQKAASAKSKKGKAQASKKRSAEKKSKKVDNKVSSNS